MTPEEKLELAKEWYNDQKATEEEKSLLEKLFPEFRDSEDEKLRKALLKNLTERFGTKGTMGNNLEMPKVIAWLEKQGELPHWKKSILPNDTVTGFNSDYFSYNGYYINYKELFNKLPKDNFNFEKQGEQSKQHLYDIIIALWDLLDKIDTFSDLQIDDTNPDNPFRKIEHITQERHKFVKSDGYNLYIKGEQITDFKQIEQEYPLTPDERIKSAWSENDKQILEIITSVLRANFNPKERFSGYEEYTTADLINWLNSLEERHFKPTDEQIIALRWTLNNIPYCNHKEEISELLDQLKNL